MHLRKDGAEHRVDEKEGRGNYKVNYDLARFGRPGSRQAQDVIQLMDNTINKNRKSGWQKRAFMNTFT